MSASTPRLTASTCCSRATSISGGEKAIPDAAAAPRKNGDFDRLLRLLAPDAAVTADDAAILIGTPRQIEGRDEVATFFNGSAQAALPVFVGDRPSSAWFHLGAAKVVFDFTVNDGLVCAITFRAAPDVLCRVVRRDGARRAADSITPCPDSIVSTSGHQSEGDDHEGHEDHDLPCPRRGL